MINQGVVALLGAIPEDEWSLGWLNCSLKDLGLGLFGLNLRDIPTTA